MGILHNLALWSSDQQQQDGRGSVLGMPSLRPHPTGSESAPEQDPGQCVGCCVFEEHRFTTRWLSLWSIAPGLGTELAVEARFSLPKTRFLLLQARVGQLGLRLCLILRSPPSQPSLAAAISLNLPWWSDFSVVPAQPRHHAALTDGSK